MAKKRINLSQHTLDINPRNCDLTQFDFSEMEDFVRELTGTRTYQYEAIRNIMVYLWGGKYNSVVELAEENYAKKESIQQWFQSKEHFLNMLPLRDKISGVCHLATGTGKSYVIIAVAYLSILLGKVKRVLVLGPSSTVIEEGLTDKFREYMYGEKGIALREKLPEKYRNVHVNLLNCNDPIEDNSIVIENINAIYRKDNNSIGDTLFKRVDEVLVLSDEVHHAYSHLDFSKPILEYDFKVGEEGKGEDRNERLWMKFLREESKITRHIGFTGTPYNQNVYFTDIIYNYSIKDALEAKYIKDINPIIKTVSDEGETDLTLQQKYQQVLQTHYENKRQYSYEKNKKQLVKPITIFINNTQASAQKNANEFVKVLAEYLKEYYPQYKILPRSEVESKAYSQIIVPISSASEGEYKQQLTQIEEVNPKKVGGEVEFIFAVNKLSEGWDVDNVFQIVPMEERVFNSKLLISQVIGRGLRIPRRVKDQFPADIMANYPVVTITNHEKFADNIKELLSQVTNCDMSISSKVFEKDTQSERFAHHFSVFNINYLQKETIVEKEKTEYTRSRTLELSPQTSNLEIKVEYLKGTNEFRLSKDFTTLDQVVADTYRKFKNVTIEHASLDFEDGFDVEELPDREEIERIVKTAIDEAGIVDDKISVENRKTIELFFNQYLPRGSKKVLHETTPGNIVPAQTLTMRASTSRTGDLDNEVSLFMSESWEQEMDETSKFFIEELKKSAVQLPLAADQEQIEFGKKAEFDSSLLGQLIPAKNVFTVNPSAFKTPQNCVLTSHSPERDFVFKLIEYAKYIDSWVKSPDSVFYSLNYEYWKEGKDRVVRSFNPDFFVKIDLPRYIDLLTEAGETEFVKNLESLRDKGIESLVVVVEIKSEDDRQEITNAKEAAAKAHFELLNAELQKANPVNYSKEVARDIRQYNVFELLRPDWYDVWFGKLRRGGIVKGI